MARLSWDTAGARYFETGVDRGVLYTKNDIGVPWNGLLSVSEDPMATETRSYYLDGVKYLEVPGRDEFGGSIQAFTYPSEFEYHDGTIEFAPGLLFGQQRRKPFAFSYRTKVGNDIVGTERAYKLHIVYNALAKPTTREYSTLSGSVDSTKFSWDFTTVPKKPANIPVAPVSHVVLDSRRISLNLLRFIEAHLYGSERNGAQLIPLDGLFDLFSNPQLVFRIVNNPLTGINQLSVQQDEGDLFGDIQGGIYQALPESRLTETSVRGVYRLES
jgi:hypothetical protein